MTDQLTMPLLGSSKGTLPGSAKEPNAQGKFTWHDVDASVHQHLSTVYWQWRRLYDSDQTATASQNPDYLLTELTYQEKAPFPPRLLVCAQGSLWTHAAALVSKTLNTRKAGAIGPRCVLQGYRLAGGNWLVHPEHDAQGAELYEPLLNEVAAQGAQFLMVEDLDQRSQLYQLVQFACEQGWRVIAPQGLQPRLRIRLPESADEYWNTFTSKTRQTFRRKLKKLGAHELQRVTAVEDVADFLAAAHEISLQTWQTRQFGLRIRNDARELALYGQLAQAGLLRCYLWRVEGRPVAFCVGDQRGGVFNYQEVGYVTDYARYSPGQMLLVKMLDDLFAENRPEWFDFGGGDADYKRMFANDISESGTILLLPPTICSHAVHTWLVASQSVRAKARKLVKWAGLATRARQWIRYGGAKTEIDEIPGQGAANPADAATARSPNEDA